MYTELLSREDCISESFIGTILSELLPLEDAVRSSTLSSKWRSTLEFDDERVPGTTNVVLPETKVKPETQCLYLHDDGFTLSTAYLQSYADVDKWLDFLSLKDVKELKLELGVDEWCLVSSSLFSCGNLVSMELVRCEVNPPLNFEGFLYLKKLSLQQVDISSEDMERLVSSCPLLESLALSYTDCLELTIRAPNLKNLMLEGEFQDIYLENSPTLTDLSVGIYITDGIAELSRPSPICNLHRLLGGVPDLERLSGRIYFTEYMSMGNTLWKAQPTYLQLKVIGLDQVSFEDMKEVMVILRMVLSAPNLLQLQVSGLSNSSLATKPPDLDFWEKECVYENTFKRLEVVMMTNMSGFPHEMKLMEFLLGSSPALDIMIITSSEYVTQRGVDALMKLESSKRASPEADLIFFSG